jgi:Transmembrane domain of unknown function (DUF3566)
MTELSSTGEAAGAESLRRSTVPAPPRPPAPLHDDAMGFDDGGPATSAMSAVPAAEPTDRGYHSGSSYTSTVLPESVLPDDRLTGIAPALPPAPTSRPSRVQRRPDRRPKVTVRGPRRAKLVIRRVDPWSVLKFSILISVCLVIVWVVSVGALFSLLRTMHVFDNINSVLSSATSGPGSKGIHINPTSHQVTEWAAILGAVNALLFTALATLGAFLYNLISMLVGGVEVTLAERD